MNLMIFKRIIVLLASILLFFGCSRSNFTITEDLSIPRFIQTEAGTIYDLKTDLEWRMGPNKDMSWYESLIWVHELNQNENIESTNKKWRIPQVMELTDLYKNLTIRKAENNPLLNEHYQWLWSGSFPGCNNEFHPATVMFFGDGGWSPTNPYYTPLRRVFAVRVNQELDK